MSDFITEKDEIKGCEALGKPGRTKPEWLTDIEWEAERAWVYYSDAVEAQDYELASQRLATAKCLDHKKNDLFNAWQRARGILANGDCTCTPNGNACYYCMADQFCEVGPDAVLPMGVE